MDVETRTQEALKVKALVKDHVKPAMVGVDEIELAVVVVEAGPAALTHVHPAAVAVDDRCEQRGRMRERERES